MAKIKGLSMEEMPTAHNSDFGFEGIGGGDTGLTGTSQNTLEEAGSLIGHMPEPSPHSVRNMGAGVNAAGEPVVEISVAKQGQGYEHGNLAPSETFKTGPGGDTFASSGEKMAAEKFAGGALPAGVDPATARIENMEKRSRGQRGAYP